MLSVTWTIVWFSSSTRLLNDKQFHYNSLKRRMLHQTNLRFVLFLSGCFNMTPQSISLTQAPYLLNSWFICVWTKNAINYLRKRILKWNFCTIISLYFFSISFFKNLIFFKNWKWQILPNNEWRMLIDYKNNKCWFIQSFSFLIYVPFE